MKDTTIGIIMTILGVVGVGLLFALILGISFGITALLVYGICWAFGYTFTWKLAVGVFLVLILLKHIFK